MIMARRKGSRFTYPARVVKKSLLFGEGGYVTILDINGKNVSYRIVSTFNHPLSPLSVNAVNDSTESGRKNKGLSKAGFVNHHNIGATN